MDSDSTHSFVSHHFAKHMNVPLEFLDYDLFVAVPSGAPLISSCVYQNCEIREGDQLLTIDLVQLVIQHFNIILGIDWLSVNHVVIDCEHKSHFVFKVKGLCHCHI